MFENILKFFKKLTKTQNKETKSKDSAKERLHLVLMQDRANVSADFLDLMKQEIIEVIKKYIDVDEKEIDVRLTNKTNDDGTNGAPILYANIPIVSIKEETKKKAEKPTQSTSDEIEEKQPASKNEEKAVTQIEEELPEQENKEDNTSETPNEVEHSGESDEETTKQIDEACEIIEETLQEEKKLEDTSVQEPKSEENNN